MRSRPWWRLIQLALRPLSLEWWRRRLAADAESGSGLNARGRVAFAHAESTLRHALTEFRQLLGDDFVEKPLRELTAAQYTQAKPPRGLPLKIAQAEQARLACGAGIPPSHLEQACWIACVGDSLRTAAFVDGAAAVLAKLAHRKSGDDAAFEVLAAAELVRRTGDPARVRFVPPTSDKTPDLHVMITDGVWTSVECKRQRDDGDESKDRDAACGRLSKRLAKLKTVAVPITFHVSALRAADVAAEDWIIRAGAELIAECRASAGIRAGDRFDRTEPSGKARLVICVREEGDGQLRFSNSEALAGTQIHSGSMGLNLGRPGPVVPRTMTNFYFGPRPPARDAKNLIERASPQLPEDGGGVVAVWLRAADPVEWDAATAALAAELNPGKNTRVSGVLAFGVEPLGLFGEADEVGEMLRVQWLAHPKPKIALEWPGGALA